MPFWWPRRRRWWYGTRYKRRYPKTRRRKRRRRFPRRKQRRRTTRRRYRRRKKVRRKIKKLAVKVWQPDTIRKCRIRGWALHVLGGHGKQWACYTDNRFDWVPAKAPGGGGFGCEKFTLEYLYQEHKRNNNRWSTTNVNLDLCRYTGCKFVFYRHPYVDFVAAYSLNSPMDLEKYTYQHCHPDTLIKAKHHKIIPSYKTYPFGKRTVKMKVKCPKLMSTKWFFQDQFSKQGLLTLYTAACDLRFSYLGCCNTNQLLSIYALNLQQYQLYGWGNKKGEGTPYAPHTGVTGSSNITFTAKDINNKALSGTIKRDNYTDSVSYQNGWFQTQLLRAAKDLQLTGASWPAGTTQDVMPCTVGRYNPTIDTGDGNKIWLVSVVNSSISPPKTDNVLIAEGLPLWQLFYGFADWVQKNKGDSTFLKSYVLLFTSRFVFPFHTQSNYWLPLDLNFIHGKGPWEEYIPKYDRDHWYPTLDHQQETIAAFVNSGPYIPKLDNQRDSTWELKSKYTFYFKWGGSELPDQPTADPTKQAHWDPPGIFSETLQIINPKKIHPASTLHCWDYRRGFITPTALKRMCQDQETDTSFYSDPESPPNKKKKLPENSIPLQQEEDQALQACLQELFKENTFQEIPQETETIQQLILQQQQQQQQLKDNLLQLISHLKLKQTQLQLQTGILP
nr:MAG: ORF1 [Torque teno midi virus]